MHVQFSVKPEPGRASMSSSLQLKRRESTQKSFSVHTEQLKPASSCGGLWKRPRGQCHSSRTPASSASVNPCSGHAVGARLPNGQ